MEDRTARSYDTAIPKKSRSLDLKSLYKSKVTKETEKNLKRKDSPPVGGDEKRNKKKKTRKEVSLSSLENADGCSKKVIHEECHGRLSSDRQNFGELKSGVSQKFNRSSGFDRVPLSLDDDVHIPKRKRGFVRRKKFEVSQGPNLAGQSSGKSGLVDQMPKLSRDDVGRGVESSKIKQKFFFDEFKENRSSDSNSVKHSKGNKDCGRHSVVNSGNSSLKKSRRIDRKRKVLAPDSTSVVREAEPLIDTSKRGDDLQEDDEENLEENAAMMLSSRFDPSCTGFSSNNKSSTLSSMNGLSFLLSSDQNVVSRGSKSLFGSESASVDTAGRVLRPRKQRKVKGSSRKRRHFYEISAEDLDAYWVLNQRIKVFWPLDQSWYYGLVNDYDKEKKLHHVKYDDRDEEWIDLLTERFKLLLLPSEVPGNARGKRIGAKNRNSGEPKGSTKSKKEREKRELNAEDDSCGASYMDSEPIISWLARSSHRVKSSPFHGIKKQKTSLTSSDSASSLLYEEPVKANEFLAKSSLWGDKSNLSSSSVLQDKLGGSSREKSSLQSATFPKDGKLPIVYFRRRFRRSNPILSVMYEEKQAIRNAPALVSFVPVVGRDGDVKAQDDRGVGINWPLWFTHSEGVSKISIVDMESLAFRFDLSYPIRLMLNNSFESENLWLVHTVLMLHHGTVMTKWPRIHLEMLFVDNIVGLRYLLFEGCLKMAAAFVFLVLRVFHQPADQGKFVDLQLPITSIRFKFSCMTDIKKQLVFEFYNFSRVNNSKWMYLDCKINRHCLFSKQLHLSECTYDNIQALQNGIRQFPVKSVSGEPSSFKVMQKRTRPSINVMGVSKESIQVDTSQSSDTVKRKLPPFALSFAAAPTFFLSLHLKLLMERSVSHISFCDPAPADDLENTSLMADGYSSTDDYSNRNSESTLNKSMMTSSKDAASGGWSYAESELVIGPSAGSNGTLAQNYIVLHDAGVSSPRGSEMHDTVQLQKWQTHDSSLELGSSPSRSLIDKDRAEDGSHSFLDHLNVQIPSVNHVVKPMDGDLHVTQNSSDLHLNMNGGVIPNPTAPRSSWPRNKNSFSSLGFLSHGSSDGKADSFNNGFSNGPKKPRTQVSYSLPFGGYDFTSKQRSHHQKGFPNKRIRKSNEKKSSDVSRSSEKNFESLSCDANLLITLGDKGWRESGAQVVLELFHHNEWKLSVKLSGIMRHSYKAHQFLQPGSTNRYSHAMMWKGGKDWILEFPDRSHWALFKEMHEECYNRNIRAASVKNIPIPGVCLTEEIDDIGPEVTFARGSKYFRQVETDVKMAMDPSRVLYDMDSDDERWMLNFQNSEKDKSSLEGISEEMFERTMDMFEKAAYVKQREEFNSDEIEELIAGVRPMSIAKKIYEHWQWKRKKKGMALIRHFQPPLWERYQEEVRDWEVAMTKNNTSIPNGCPDKVVTLEKPPMFAFCMKPRGLEVPNKGSKQRSQKKLSVSGQTHSIIGDQDGFHTFGRRPNGYVLGDEKFIYPRHNYDSFDDSPLPQTSPRVFSPRDASGMGYVSLSNDGFDRNQIPKLHRSKSKKHGSFVYYDSQMVSSCSPRMFGNRNGVNRWNMGYYDLPNHRQYLFEGPQRHGIEQLDGSDLDEFRLRDASGAAQHALNMAKLKRERAQRLLYRADLAIHKAVAALMTAEAMKASEESNGAG
ncbi:hypothetical protein L6164_024254 [Bauhinia variegata]|uniref:Uncharacterized protein n=1 Tax=Bauhinia variegata TaxID=167791 RepID=A0ACB9LX07_BAUVA|nr:hypothetical protein L6164_024254 [Bauhinia variegata]